jgi:hypothetical protein
MLLAVLLALALQSPPEEAAVFWSNVEGTRWESVVRWVDVFESPRWQASEDNPPLSPRAAVRSARSVLLNMVERAEDWALVRVSLQSIADRADLWIYVVEFSEARPDLSNQSGGVIRSALGSPLSMVVMMDGTAVTPVRRP